jgi:hypothetical protein
MKCELTGFAVEIGAPAAKAAGAFRLGRRYAVFGISTPPGTASLGPLFFSSDLSNAAYAVSLPPRMHRPGGRTAS